jgi:uncharacterized protein (DUF1778 family)
MSREYTEQQKKFLAALESSMGNVRVAMDEAGYSKTTPTSYVIKSLRDEIEQIARNLLVSNSIRGVHEILNTLDNPSHPGNKYRLQAAKELLDRAGIVKEDKINIEHSGGIVILPRKVDTDDVINLRTDTSE